MNERVTDIQRVAWRQEWERSAALQAEFTSAGSYAAFRAAEAEGRCRILGRAGA